MNTKDSITALIVAATLGLSALVQHGVLTPAESSAIANQLPTLFQVLIGLVGVIVAILHRRAAETAAVTAAQTPAAPSAPVPFPAHGPGGFIGVNLLLFVALVGAAVTLFIPDWNKEAKPAIEIVLGIVVAFIVAWMLGYADDKEERAPDRRSGFAQVKLLALIAAVVVAFVLAGCASTNGTQAAGNGTLAISNTTTGGDIAANLTAAFIAQTPAELAANLQTATSLGAAVALAEKPSLRPDLQAAYEALTVASANGHTSSAQLIADLNAEVSPANQKAVDAVFAVVLADFDSRLKADAPLLTADQSVAEARTLLAGIQAGLKVALST